ncbi:MAG TPA: alpha/beta hydrolase [Solirubrobacterales bacterium]|nr:alpha/beta hydrolase [Solirubrobacterales bacterium]
MWESLATTRRQDRVLHGVAKVLNVVFGALLLPAWLLGQWVSGPFRRLFARFGGQGPGLPVPPAGERSMDALMGELKAVPHNLHPSQTAELRKGLLDWAPFVLAQHRHTVGWGYSYPGQFRHDHFAGADGERIGAMVALHEHERPGLIVVHGLFSNRLFDYVREIAVRAYFEWGFNVAAVDLRSFGVTELLSHAPSTGGWKEGQDMVHAGRHLKQLGATSVGALGISLGASSVLNAAHLPGAEVALDGGILAICGPADTRRAAERLSRRVPRKHPAYAINRMFLAMLRSRVRSGRWPEEIDTLVEPIEAIAAPYYGVSADEIWERSSARHSIARARVPVLVLHSEDDQIVPVEHARMLDEAKGDNELVRVWIVPGGAHAAFDVLDRDWTYTVYRRFFERWAEYGERGAVGDAPAGAEVVYSTRRSGKVKTAGAGS